MNEIDKEILEVLIYDLSCLELKDTEFNKYHYDLLKGNIQDLFKGEK